MNGLKNFILLFALLLTCYLSVAQTPHVDSLKIELGLTSQPLKKAGLLIEITDALKTPAPKQALEHAEELKKLSETRPDNLIIALNLIAEIHIELADLNKAMTYAMQARQKATENENTIGYITASNHIAHIYSKLGLYDKSFEFYFDCLEKCEKLDNQVMLSKIYNGIGIVYHNQNNFKKALEYYLKALQIAREIDDLEGIGKGLNNVAAIYGVQRKDSLALNILMKALNHNREHHFPDLVGVNYLNLGYYYQEVQMYDSALQYYDKALDIYTKMDDITAIISTKIFMAEFYQTTGENTLAIELAKESLEASKKYKLKRFVYETAGLLYQTYLQNSDSLRAFTYQVLQLQMKDSLNIEEQQTEMSNLELQYQFNKAEEKFKANQQRRNLITLIIIISLVFLVVMVIMLWNRQKIVAKNISLENEKLEMNLEIRTKELTSNALAIMKKNETLVGLGKKLKAAHKNAQNEETRKTLKQIMWTLNKTVDESAWDEFNMRFQQVHNDFYKTLSQKFPSITSNEQRLCAFLKLNMTTKEISELTGQRTSTIDIARTRLRKKLGITNTQTNLVTFLSQL